MLSRRSGGPYNCLIGDGALFVIKYFNILAIAFVILLIGGFAVLKLLF